MSLVTSNGAFLPNTWAVEMTTSTFGSRAPMASISFWMNSGGNPQNYTKFSF